MPAASLERHRGHRASFLVCASQCPVVYMRPDHNMQNFCNTRRRRKWNILWVKFHGDCDSCRTIKTKVVIAYTVTKRVGGFKPRFSRGICTYLWLWSDSDSSVCRFWPVIILRTAGTETMQSFFSFFFYLYTSRLLHHRANPPCLPIWVQMHLFLSVLWEDVVWCWKKFLFCCSLCISSNTWMNLK